MRTFTIENPCLRARITDNGACLLSLEEVRHACHVLRPWNENNVWHPGEAALFPMLPFANRIANNTFSIKDHEYTLPDSPYNDPYYLHGNGWLLKWDVQHLSEDSITLRTYSDQLCSFEYVAEIKYILINDCIHAEVTVVHLGNDPMPYGLGFHPYFLTSPEDTIQFSSNGYWSEGHDHLADRWHETIPAQLDFSSPSSPSGLWINNCYSGWNGVARITNRQRSIVMRSNTPWLMVYQHYRNGFTCLEPQSHQVNAHNMPARPGLRMLRTGDKINLKMTIQVITHCCL